MDCGLAGGENEQEACTLCHDPVIEQDLAPFMETGIRQEDHRDFLIETT